MVATAVTSEQLAREAERIVDGRRRVTGELTFVNDVVCAGALHVAFALSTQEHALIRDVDLSAALAVPGVAAAISGPEIGARRIGRIVRDLPILAHDRVLYVGERVAAVAASDLTTARRAAELIDITYEPLPPVRGPAEATAAGVAALHPGYDGYTGALANRSHVNEQGTWLIRHGEPDQAFAEATDVYENVFTAARSHSAALEPHACVIVPGPTVEVYSTHKAPYDLRRDLALISGRPPEEFTIHPVYIGGDFGSKGVSLIDAACYLLAVQTGRPTRCALSFYEVLTATGARHPATLRLRTGLREGRLFAHQTFVTLDGGAYAALKAHPQLVVPAIHAPVELYRVPHVAEECTTYYSNSLPGAHVRSPGEFQAAFAGESHIDLIARARGVDSLRFRFDNSPNEKVTRVLAELDRKVTAWRDAPSTPGVGIGVALCFRDAGSGQSTTRCRVSDDGSIVITVATPDQGAGSYTVFRRIAAEALAVPDTAVEVRGVGTDSSLPDSGAGASRVTNVVGRATAQACAAVADKLGGLPAAAPADATWIVERLRAQGETELEATGTWSMGWPPPPDQDLRSYAGVAIEVEVDRETGQFRMHRAFVAADTGTVINPVAHRGQIEGGLIYGLSQATLEELLVEEGAVVTATLGDYRLMSSADIPALEVVLVESEGSLAAARSAGELTNVGGAPALANAIHDAIGIRIAELPITPERIRTAWLQQIDATDA